jgi:replicative DNA helicase
MQQLRDPGPVLPNDPRLERALLALVVTDNGVLDKLARLEPEHFHDAENREVFTLARDLRREGQPINLVTLGGLMGADPLGGTSSILDSIKAFSLAGELPDALSLEASLLTLHVRRRGLAVGDALAASMQSYAGKPAEVFEATVREIEDLRALSLPPRRTLWDAEAGTDAMLRDLESDDSARKIGTGLRDLDAMTGSIRRGDLAYLGGRPSMGKSAIAVCVGLNAAKAGFGVLIFSLEMSNTAWRARAASRAAFSTTQQVPYKRALNREWTRPEHEAFVRAALSQSGLPMWIDERSGLSMLQIMARTRAVKTQFERLGTPLGLVIVDHVGKVVPATRYKGSRANEIGEISQELAHMAKAEDIAVLGLVQLNREVETRTEQRPMLADLRDSGRLEEDADIVLLAYRQAYYLARDKHDEGSAEEITRLAELNKREHDLEIIVGKARAGMVGSVNLWCDMASNVVCDQERWREAA